jgi:hypothetical protein
MTNALTSTPLSGTQALAQGFKNVTSSPTAAWEFVKENPTPFITAGAGMLGGMMEPQEIKPMPVDKGGIQEFSYNPNYDKNGTGGYFFRPSFTPTKYTKLAEGGVASLSQGRFLEGQGDGVSDDIPAMIEGQQPAALADGEFVVPARVVSEIGNGSSKAGARKLYDMVERVQSARAKTTGKDQIAKNTKAERYLPA